MRTPERENILIWWSHLSGIDGGFGGPAAIVMHFLREPSVACHPPRHSRSVPQLHPTISSMGLATAPYTEHTGRQRGNVSQEKNTMTNWAGCVPGSNHPAGSDFSYAAGGMRGE